MSWLGKDEVFILRVVFCPFVDFFGEVVRGDVCKVAADFKAVGFV